MNLQFFLPFVVLFLLVWNIALQLQFILAHRRLKSFFRGQKASDLEGVIFEQIKRLRKTEKNLQELVKFSKILEKMAQKSIQKVGLVRFNPFKNTGGDQSFSIAMLDSFDNGIVISTLFTREDTRIYAKPIKNNESSYALSGEEKEAIEKARS